MATFGQNLTELCGVIVDRPAVPVHVVHTMLLLLLRLPVSLCCVVRSCPSRLATVLATVGHRSERGVPVACAALRLDR